MTTTAESAGVTPRSLRPKCYGRLYVEKAPECKICEAHTSCADTYMERMKPSVVTPLVGAEPEMETVPVTTPTQEEMMKHLASQPQPTPKVSPATPTGKPTVPEDVELVVRANTLGAYVVQQLRASWWTPQALVEDVVSKFGGKGTIISDMLVRARQKGLLLTNESGAHKIGK